MNVTQDFTVADQMINAISDSLRALQETGIIDHDYRNLAIMVDLSLDIVAEGLDFDIPDTVSDLIFALDNHIGAREVGHTGFAVVTDPVSKGQFKLIDLNVGEIPG